MFDAATIEDEIFKSLDFSEKSLRSHFLNVTFNSCNFTKSDWQKAEFRSCRFKNCNLSLVNLQGSRLQEIHYDVCKMVGLDFYKCAKCEHPKFTHCIMQTCNFSELKLKKTSFIGSNLRDVHFTNTDLSESDFRDCELLGTLFHQCNLSKADFRNAKNYSIDVLTNAVKKAKFSFPEAINLLKSFDIALDQEG